MDNQQFLATLGVPTKNQQKCLDQEAERAWKYQVGVTSESERQERVNESIESLRDWAKKNNKPLMEL